MLDRTNVRIMMQYVSDVNNLVLMMNLLKDHSRSIQFEAFHVFKVGEGGASYCGSEGGVYASEAEWCGGEGRGIHSSDGQDHEPCHGP